MWETATYDPETDTFYQGIGNADRTGTPIPARRQQMGGKRTRAQPERRQDQVGLPVHAERSYDFDEVSEHPIINAKVDGADRKLVVHAARNGFYYALDRTNGSFVLGKQ